MNQESTSGKTSRKDGWLLLAGVASLLGAAGGLISLFDVDRTLSGRFFTPEQGFFWAHEQPWEWLHVYGTAPGTAFVLGALVMWGMSMFAPRLASWRRPLLFLALTGVISSGVLVNGVLKPYWGRPRPVEIIEFGGEQTHRHFCQPGGPGLGQSFPSGHASISFVFASLLFLGKRSRFLWAAGGAGTGYGVLVSCARVVQGAHFVTDVMWSFGLTLMTAAVLYYWVLKIPDEASKGAVPVKAWKKALCAVISLSLAAAGAWSYYTRRPFYEAAGRPVQIQGGVSRLVIHMNVECDRFSVRFSPGEPGRAVIESEGFGAPSVSRSILQASRRQDSVQEEHFEVTVAGPWIEMHHRLAVILPQEMEGQVAVSLEAPGR